jgi:chromosome segregation ATPase
MHRTWRVILGLLFVSAPAFGQSTDSQTLQSILAEVRHLRHDLQVTTVATQKAQILFHRVDAEESVVRLMQERVDTAQHALDQIRFDRKNRADKIKQLEDQKSNNEVPEAEVKGMDDAVAQMKAMNETLAIQEQEAQAKLGDAEEQLRLEQGKLNDLEDQLNQVEKSLENLDRSPQ